VVKLPPFGDARREPPRDRGGLQRGGTEEEELVRLGISSIRGGVGNAGTWKRNRAAR